MSKAKSEAPAMKRRLQGRYQWPRDLIREGFVRSRSHLNRLVAAGRFPEPLDEGPFKTEDIEHYSQIIERGGTWQGQPSKKAPAWAVREYEQHKAEREQQVNAA